MVDYSQKLTQEFVDQARSHYEKDWGESHANWEETDQYIGLTFPVWPNANSTRVIYRPSTARQKLKHAVDVMLNHNPTIHSDPRTSSQTQKDRSDGIEEAVDEIVVDSFTRVVVPPPWLINWYLMTYNYAVLEAPILAEGTMATRPRRPRRGANESDEEFKKRMAAWRAESTMWNPIEFRVPHPATVLMDPEQAQPPMAIKTTSMMAIDLHNLSMKKSKTRATVEIFPLDKGGEFRDIKLEDVWTTDWHMLKELRGEPIYVERNTWGYNPFIHGFGGHGFVGATNNLKQRTEGILDPIKDSLKRQAQNYSAQHHVQIRHAYRPIMTTESPDELAEAMATDGIYEVDGLDAVGVPDFPEVSSFLLEAGRNIDADIDRAIPGILGGERSPGVTTVGQQAIQSSAAQRAFSLTAKATESIFTTALQRLLKLVDTQDIQILNLNKSLIGGNYRVFATFPQSDPAIKMAGTQINLQKVDRGLMSRQSFWEEEGLANTTEEERRLLIDSVKQMPEIAQLLAKNAAEEEGIGDELDEATRLREQNDALPAADNPNARDGGQAPATELREVLDGNTVTPARVGIG